VLTEENLTKLYYSISEVCEMLDVKPHVLRYWESEFRDLKPRKNRAGNRAYRKRDIELLLKIKHLLYNEKFTIEGAKIAMEKERHGGGQLPIPFDESSASNNFQLAVDKLEELKDYLEALE